MEPVKDYEASSSCNQTSSSPSDSPVPAVPQLESFTMDDVDSRNRTAAREDHSYILRAISSADPAKPEFHQGDEENKPNSNKLAG